VLGLSDKLTAGELHFNYVHWDSWCSGLFTCYAASNRMRIIVYGDLKDIGWDEVTTWICGENYQSHLLAGIQNWIHPKSSSAALLLS